MEEFPYHHDKKPDAGRHREFRRALPVLAAAAAGLAIGGLLKNGNDGQQNAATLSTVPEAKTALCSPETDWRGMPETTDWKFLASLMHVVVERAETAQVALVKCDEGIRAGDILNTRIDVEGQDGPCLPADFMPGVKSKNPFIRRKEVIAVCAGQAAEARTQEIT